MQDFRMLFAPKSSVLAEMQTMAPEPPEEDWGQTANWAKFCFQFLFAWCCQICNDMRGDHFRTTTTNEFRKETNGRKSSNKRKRSWGPKSTRQCKRQLALSRRVWRHRWLISTALFWGKRRFLGRAARTRWQDMASRTSYVSSVKAMDVKMPSNQCV